MTLQSIRFQIYEYLKDNNSIEIDEFRFKLSTILDKIDIEEWKEMVKAALDDFVENKMLKKISYKGKDKKNIEKWVLVKPLLAYNQHLEILPSQVIQIWEIINKAGDVFKGVYTVKDCDVFNISQDNIQTLILISHMALDAYVAPPTDDSEEKKD